MSLQEELAKRRYPLGRRPGPCRRQVSLSLTLTDKENEKLERLMLELGLKTRQDTLRVMLDTLGVGDFKK